MNPIPIPDLEFRPPDCPLCGDETESADEGFCCSNCILYWSADGTRGERGDDVEECGNERRPYANQARYQSIRGALFHCVLGTGHKGLCHGVRVDIPDRLDETHCWDPAAPVATR